MVDQIAPAPLESLATDRSLVRQVRDGSEQAAELLFRRYAARLRSLVWRRFSADLNRRVDVEDIVQSVFRRFFDAARKGRYDAPSGDDLWELFVVIALNRVRSEKEFQRAARRDCRRTADTSDQSANLDAAVRDDGTDAFFRLTVTEALARLPEDHRRAVELRLEGRDVAEIATKLGRPKRTVERVLKEARDLLRSDLNENG